MRTKILSFAVLVFLLGAIRFSAANDLSKDKPEVWHFDRLDSIGGHSTKILGHPKIIKAPGGKAVEFNGVDDALFVDSLPLAGAATWTWDVIFRPDGGAEEQRFFHLSVLDPATGKDTDDRMLFEIRVRDGQWCLDSYAKSGPQGKTLLNCDKKYALGQWYRVTAVYDGKTLSNYVGDELQSKGDVNLLPQGTGHAAVGVRATLVNYFKGAVLEARFTPSALPVSEFLKMPNKRK